MAATRTRGHRYRTLGRGGTARLREAHDAVSGAGGGRAMAGIEAAHGGRWRCGDLSCSESLASSSGSAELLVKEDGEAV
jgi:hypothetical protein